MKYMLTTPLTGTVSSSPNTTNNLLYNNTGIQRFTTGNVKMLLLQTYNLSKPHSCRIYLSGN